MMGDEGDLVALRLARGCRCFLAWLDESIAGYCWLSTGPEWIGELELRITPNVGEAYIWNCVTVPEHRRKGVFRSLLTGVSAIARKEGLQRLWIASLAIPASKAVGPAGFRPALDVASTVLQGFVWINVQPASGADPELTAAAHRVLATPAGRFLRSSHPRRH